MVRRVILDLNIAAVVDDLPHVFGDVLQQLVTKDFNPTGEGDRLPSTCSEVAKRVDKAGLAITRRANAVTF